MKRPLVTTILTLLAVLVSPALKAGNILEHGGVGMTKSELEREVARWSSDMQRAAANDNGDMLELLNKALVAKKIAVAGMQLTEQENPELYWKIQFKIREEVERIMIQGHVANLDIPDMQELAKERYLVDKDRWALVPEQRLSSHILIMCNKASCDRDAARATADSVLQKLNEGGDFAALAAEYSQDKASKDKGGRFERWLKQGEPGVVKPYTEALYRLEQVGDLSPVTVSQFGFHIIKLDELKPAYYRTFEEVEQEIITALETEFRTEAARAYVRSFNLDDTAKMDAPAMQELFAPYKTP